MDKKYYYSRVHDKIMKEFGSFVDRNTTSGPVARRKICPTHTGGDEDARRRLSLTKSDASQFVIVLGGQRHSVGELCELEFGLESLVNPPDEVNGLQKHLKQPGVRFLFGHFRARRPTETKRR